MKRLSFSDLIIFENTDYLAINKPPFIATLEDRVDTTNILSLARQTMPQAQVCHRLDKDTSGALLIAKHPEAYRHASLQFEHRQVKKIYHAVTDGVHAFQQKEVDLPIIKQNDGTAKIAREGKEAQTIFTTLQPYRQHTLVECRPVTGRMHQIRVHLAWLKAPICGDTQYGGQLFYLSTVKRGFNLKKATEEEPFLKRMALHAFALEFTGMDGAPLNLEAPYPKDFRALTNQLAENKR